MDQLMKWNWEQFGVRVEGAIPDPVRKEQNPELILRTLRLNNALAVRIQFYETTEKAVVIVQAKEVNPSWQVLQEASRKSGWAVEVVAATRFERLKRLAFEDFCSLESVSADLAKILVDHGYFTFDDLASIKPDDLMRIGTVDMQQVDAIIQEAELQAEQMEI